MLAFLQKRFRGLLPFVNYEVVSVREKYLDGYLSHVVILKNAKRSVEVPMSLVTLVPGSSDFGTKTYAD